MSEDRVIKARYADWRTVKGRKVLQLVLEVPLEQQDEALRMLGAPLPDRDLWVAIARLNEAQNDSFKGGRLAKKAGILCNEIGFQKWAGAENPDGAAIFIRQRCGVESRAMLDHEERAARAFKNMELEYQNWLRDAA